MKLNISVLKSNKKLLTFMAFSYLDKGIIFLLPLIVLYFFKDETVYISIEYIYSLIVVVIPLLDLGLAGYFFYAYRESDNHEKTIKTFVNTFKRLYSALFIIGIVLIAFHYFIFPFEDFIVFIVFRILFVVGTVFLASYYRLTDRPQHIVYITIFSNLLSLGFVFFYFISDLDFSLWLIFIGQILFSIGFFFKSVFDVFIKELDKDLKVQFSTLIKASLLFSWPTIFQTFLQLYVTNYGKINALTHMSIDDGVLLSLTQRFSMLIFLTHSSVWAFLIKDVYIEKDIYVINKNIFYKYLAMISIALFTVLIIVGFYITYSYSNDDYYRPLRVSILIIGQTFLSCIYAYLELNYGRENKNIIKLYLAVFGALIFVISLTFLDVNFLERIAISMFISTLMSLLVSIFVLYKRNYRVV